MDGRSLEARVEAVATRAGIDRVGFCDVSPFEDVLVSITERVAEGFNGRLGFTFRQPETACDLRESYPWAESLVVAGMSYLPESGRPGPAEPGTGRVSRFAVVDSYIPLRTALAQVKEVLEGEGLKAEMLVDDSRLVDRAAAVRAGIGWWGKNTMVLAPHQGPWMLLGSVVTDAHLRRSEPMARNCGTCQACLPACPTGALVAPGVLDARRCLAAIAQSPGSIPLELREAMSDRIYGCDDCLEACPPGMRMLERTALLPPKGRMDLLGLLALGDDELIERFSHFFIPRRRARFLRRNILVALGNSGTVDHLSAATSYLGDPDPLLRGHAAWAVGRMGGETVRTALRAALDTEKDTEVRGELISALGTQA